MDSPFMGYLLQNFNVGDSLSFKVEPELFFRDVFDTVVPFFMKQDSFVKANICIEMIMNEADYNSIIESAEFKKEAALWQQKEKQSSYHQSIG